MTALPIATHLAHSRIVAVAVSATDRCCNRLSTMPMWGVSLLPVSLMRLLWQLPLAPPLRPGAAIDAVAAVSDVA